MRSKAGDYAVVTNSEASPLPGDPSERMFVPVDRFSELEAMRRSMAMLLPGQAALDREEAMRLLRELQEVESRFRSLRDGLRRLLDDEDKRL